MDGFGLRWMAMLGLAACGPAVATSEDGGDTSADSGGTSTESAGSMTGSTATSTGTMPFDVGGPLPSLQGEHLFALAAVIDPAHPLQWLATITQTESGGQALLTIELQPLALDVQSTTTPRTPVGEPMVVQAGFGEDGSFGIELPTAMVPGAANPITGSDIVAQIVIEGSVQSDDLWCGAAFGMVSQPLMLDLAGSTFAGTRITGGVLPGDPIPAACP